MYSLLSSYKITLLKKRENNIMETVFSKFKPFRFVKKDEKSNFVIVAGNVQVSPHQFETTEEAEKYLTEQPYEAMTNFFSTLLYYHEKENQSNAKENA